MRVVARGNAQHGRFLGSILKMGLDPQLVHAAAKVQFRNGTDITDFFQHFVAAHFIDWFNARCAMKGNWTQKKLGSSPEVKTRFTQIWNNSPLMFERVPINLIQFAALMSILINEVGADLLPIAERCGRQNYPGLAYPFENIPGVKTSYNSGANRRAGDLFFNDENFWQAHGSLATADLVRALPEVREAWNGSVYLRNLFPTSLDPSHAGFIQQADFFKFRGRGFIQLTWRANYKLIVKFVQDYKGSNAVISRYKADWAGKDPDLVCTVTTNDDWDTLFEETDFIVPCRAIGLHNETQGRYLSLSDDAAILTATKPVRGSLYGMGLRINGAPDYASLFMRRVGDLINELGYKAEAR